ncbi:hypothetical protein [Pedobacter arcticus]|uniref:hypothetical protein n=1 Tax=Pedobacter arcticus TaxID=752140 RepID=UPI0002E5D74C|nr:hypothetical protein [Pedobacter arcticus]
MKRILTLLLLFVVFAATISSCKKDTTGINGGGKFEAIDYTFNKATRSFEPVEAVTAQITSPKGIRFVYCFLIREDQTDSLIYVSNNSGENPTSYDLSIPTESFPAYNMTKVKGVKVLVKQTDNSSIEGFINVNFFDPDLPQLINFPTQITADLTGGKTTITGKVTSIYGLKRVDIYDDYQTEDTYVLVNSITEANGLKEYTLNYAYGYRKAAQHIKIVAVDIYNQPNEVIINMPVDVAIFKPKFANFATAITPIQTGGTTSVTGKITAITGLKRVDIYDDYKGAYVLVGTVNNLNGVLDYNFNYGYTFRKRAEHIKLVAIDQEDLQTELIIPLNITYGSVAYRDIVMTAQNAGTATALLMNGTTIGNCELLANEANIIMLFGQQSAGLTFFNPASPGSFPANLKCNNVGWVPNNTAVIHKTQFRVLVKGVTGVNNIYTLLDNNEIDDLSDAFFTGISAPTSNTPRYTATAAATASLFNLTDGKLVYLKITDPLTSITKNALICIKDAKDDGAVNSTIKFDIYIQK